MVKFFNLTFPLLKLPGGYLLASERAQLLIPFELVLANHDSDYSQMCIRFNYFMKR